MWKEAVRPNRGTTNSRKSRQASIRIAWDPVEIRTGHNVIIPTVALLIHIQVPGSNLGQETEMEGIRGNPGKLQDSALKYAHVDCLEMLHNL